MAPHRSKIPSDIERRISDLAARFAETERELRALFELGPTTDVDRPEPDAVLVHAALLDAVPANVALIDPSGDIVAVNKRWQEYGTANASTQPSVGQNYLDICDNARGDFSEDAPAVALGIRRVLSGRVTSFAREYPCHSPSAQHWYSAVVLPFTSPGTHARGAIVLHIAATNRGVPEAPLGHRVAHELNNALSPILLAVEELRRGTVDAARLELVDTIEENARRGADVIRRVRASAQGDATSTASQPAAKGSGRSAPSMPRGNGEQILVVDDEPAIRAVVRRTLEHFGYRVILAADGAEAVARYKALGTAIAAVLTDVAMPIMDGPAAVRAMRAINPHVRVIVSSGHASGLGELTGTDADATQFIAKPYAVEDLLHVMRRVLDAPGRGAAP